MNNLCTDIGYRSLIKYGEQLCGDHVEVVNGSDGSVIAVLADGLGSGVKANILSTLTAKIISTMTASSMSIEECVSTVAATLPVCSEREVAYSTFTIIIITEKCEAEIIQYDNPHVILIRNGKNYEFSKNILEIGGKSIYRSKISVKEGDVFTAVSDGAIYAGVGESMNFGWQRDNIVDFLEHISDPGFTARTITTLLLDECDRLYGGKPGDDTTVCTVKIRKREAVNLIIGPPADPCDASKMMALFFGKEGKHIVCGGTTSSIAADFLGKSLVTQLDYVDPKIPPIAKIEGVDLVTEGIITINKVLSDANEYFENTEGLCDWSYKRDGASMIARILFEEATDINFFVGKAINPAHQNPDLPINFNIKMRLVDELTEKLSKMGKQIKVSYF